MPFSPEQPIIGPQHVKRQLLGISSFLATLDQTELSALLTDSIMSAQNRFERELETYFGPRVIKTRPTASMVQGVDYDVQEDPYDFPVEQIRWLGFFTTRRRPIISVERICVAYGPDPNNTFLVYPGVWIQTEKVLGRISIVPVGGTILPASVGAQPSVWWWLPQLVGAQTGGMVPDLVTIDYTAGLVDADSDPQYHELRIALAKAAAEAAFPSISSLFPTSTARDGVSVSYGMITQLQQQMNQDVENFITEWNAERRAFHMVVV